MQTGTDCRRASNEGDGQDKAAWLRVKRAEEQTASKAWSEQYRMPPPEGTERAVPRGRALPSPDPEDQLMLCRPGIRVVRV